MQSHFLTEQLTRVSVLFASVFMEESVSTLKLDFTRRLHEPLLVYFSFYYSAPVLYILCILCLI
jgi:hypothetical protein